jgi:hypothetical protein
MSVGAWILAVTMMLTLDGLSIACISSWHARQDDEWLEHDRWLERLRAYTLPDVIVHASGEYPVAAGWDEDAILSTLAEIEAL